MKALGATLSLVAFFAVQHTLDKRCTAANFTSAAAVPQPAPASTGGRRLTLAEAEQLVFKNNLRIGESQFQERAYEEVVREFLAAYLPSLYGQYHRARRRLRSAPICCSNDYKCRC